MRLIRREWSFESGLNGVTLVLDCTFVANGIREFAVRFRVSHGRCDNAVTKSDGLMEVDDLTDEEAVHQRTGMEDLDVSGLRDAVSTAPGPFDGIARWLGGRVESVSMEPPVEMAAMSRREVEGPEEFRRGFGLPEVEIANSDYDGSSNHAAVNFDDATDSVEIPAKDGWSIQYECGGDWFEMVWIPVGPEAIVRDSVMEVLEEKYSWFEFRTVEANKGESQVSDSKPTVQSLLAGERQLRNIDV